MVCGSYEISLAQLLTLNEFRRKHRRIAFTWLNQRAVDTYSDVLDRESLVLVKAILEESKGGKVAVNPQVSYYHIIIDKNVTYD